jgi:hypothetical protein
LERIAKQDEEKKKEMMEGWDREVTQKGGSGQVRITK